MTKANSLWLRWRLVSLHKAKFSPINYHNLETVRLRAIGTIIYEQEVVYEISIDIKIEYFELSWTLLLHLLCAISAYVTDLQPTTSNSLKIVRICDQKPRESSFPWCILMQIFWLTTRNWLQVTSRHKEHQLSWRCGAHLVIGVWQIYLWVLTDLHLIGDLCLSSVCVLPTFENN